MKCPKPGTDEFDKAVERAIERVAQKNLHSIDPAVREDARKWMEFFATRKQQEESITMTTEARFQEEAAKATRENAQSMQHSKHLAWDIEEAFAQPSTNRHDFQKEKIRYGKRSIFEFLLQLFAGDFIGPHDIATEDGWATEQSIKQTLSMLDGAILWYVGHVCYGHFTAPSEIPAYNQEDL